MTELDWRAVLAERGRYELRPGVAEPVLRDVEARLDFVFPADLRALYLVTDGVYDNEGLWNVIWPLTELIEANQWAWAEEGPERQRLVGFGDDGTGDPFCVPRDGSPGVYSWALIGRETSWIGDNVKEFWDYWTNGGGIPRLTRPSR